LTLKGSYMFRHEKHPPQEAHYLSWWKNFDNYQDARYVRENYRGQPGKIV
jgi:hypothetical protein